MFLENNRSRIEKQFETFCQKLPGIAAHINKRMDALNPDVIAFPFASVIAFPFSSTRGPPEFPGATDTSI